MKLFRNSIFLISIVCYSCNSSGINESHPAYIDKILDSANRLVDQGKQQIAFSFVDSSFRTIKNAGFEDRWKVLAFKSAKLSFAATVNKDSTQFAEALLYADSMLKIMDGKGEKYNHERFLSNLIKGDALFDLKRYKEAYQFFYNAQTMADQSSDKCQEERFKRRFALLNFKQKKFNIAAKLYMQAYNYQLYCPQDFANYAAIQGTLNNAGLSYMSNKMPDSALACYNKAIIFLNENKRRFPLNARFTSDAYGVTYHNMAITYIDRGDYVKAIASLKKTIALNERGGNEQRNAQMAKIVLARINLEMGNGKETLKLLNQLRLAIDTLASQRSEQEWQKLMWNYQLSIKQQDSAKFYLNNYLKIKDENEKAEQDMLNADYEEEFYNLKKEYEVNLLKKENQLHDFYLILTIGFSILSILIVAILFRNISSSRRNNKVLNEINKQMIEQNEYLHKTLEELEESQVENTRVMQIITHDLRSPMAAIVGLSDFMIQEHNLSEEDLEVVSLINTSGTDSLKFINEILEKETVTSELKKEQIDLDQLLTYCTTQLKYKAKEKNQDITLNSVPVQISLAREKIWRVLSNLITNAIKFSPNNAVIEVSLKVEGRKAIIAVKDNGIGIPENLKDKIFEASDEAKREGTSGEKSFGLGLAISKRIIEEHHGSLSFKSQLGDGTTFFIELPID